MNIFPASPVLLAGVVLCAAGCANPQPTADKPQMRALGQSVKSDAEQLSDDAIGNEIRRRFELADAADTASLIIAVDGGHVTLSGAARSLAAAWRAEGVARAVPGVKDVTNRIMVNQSFTN